MITSYNRRITGDDKDSLCLANKLEGAKLYGRTQVFALHAATKQQALARYPRMPATIPSCATTSPPSIELADPTFAVAANATAGYEMRWDAFVTLAGRDSAGRRRP